MHHTRWLIAGVLAACACTKPEGAFRPIDYTPDYNAPLPPGALALQKIGPEEYPDFSQAFYRQVGLDQAIQNSLEYLARPSSRRYFPYADISHERAVASLERMRTLLASAASPEELNATIVREFDVYRSIGWDGYGTVFFTGYYCPIFEGRRQPDARFRYPLYGLPPDLVKGEEGKILGRRLPDGGITPYYTRREIEESGILRGLEVVWLKDPFEAYVATVQGSARIRLEDGSLMELGYAGNNGHEYKPIADALIEDGILTREQLSLQRMLAHFRSHPQDVPRYCWVNDRTVFFKPTPGGPYGSLNVPVTPFHSIATDKEVFPRACIALVHTTLPQLEGNRVRSLPFSAFALDQDTGGAIRAAGRCDVYMGIGAQAEAVAGRTGAEGQLYYVFVKSAPTPMVRQRPAEPPRSEPAAHRAP